MVNTVECCRLTQSNEDCRLTTVEAFVHIIDNLQQCGLCAIMASFNALRIGVVRIFRGWVRPTVDARFLVRGTMERPKAQARRGRREALERRGVGSGEGRRSPSPVWGLGAMPPEILCNLTCKSVHFDVFLRLSQTLN